MQPDELISYAQSLDKLKTLVVNENLLNEALALKTQAGEDLFMLLLSYPAHFDFFLINEKVKNHLQKLIILPENKLDASVLKSVFLSQDLPFFEGFKDNSQGWEIFLKNFDKKTLIEKARHRQWKWSSELQNLVMILSNAAGFLFISAQAKIVVEKKSISSLEYAALYCPEAFVYCCKNLTKAEMFQLITSETRLAHLKFPFIMEILGRVCIPFDRKVNNTYSEILSGKYAIRHIAAIHHYAMNQGEESDFAKYWKTIMLFFIQAKHFNGYDVKDQLDNFLDGMNKKEYSDT